MNQFDGSGPGEQWDDYGESRYGQQHGQPADMHSLDQHTIPAAVPGAMPSHSTDSLLPKDYFRDIPYQLQQSVSAPSHGRSAMSKGLPLEPSGEPGEETDASKPPYDLLTGRRFEEGAAVSAAGAGALAAGVGGGTATQAAHLSEADEASSAGSGGDVTKEDGTDAGSAATVLNEEAGSATVLNETVPPSPNLDRVQGFPNVRMQFEDMLDSKGFYDITVTFEDISSYKKKSKPDDNAASEEDNQAEADDDNKAYFDSVTIRLVPTAGTTGEYSEEGKKELVRKKARDLRLSFEYINQIPDPKDVEELVTTNRLLKTLAAVHDDPALFEVEIGRPKTGNGSLELEDLQRSECQPESKTAAMLSDWKEEYNEKIEADVEKGGGEVEYKADREGTMEPTPGTAEDSEEVRNLKNGMLKQIKPCEPYVEPEISLDTKKIFSSEDTSPSQIARAFARHESFVIRDVHQSSKEFDKMVVDRNIDGTYVTFVKNVGEGTKKADDVALTFRIGSRAMSNDELQEKIATLAPLMKEDCLDPPPERNWKFWEKKQPAIKQSELLTKLLRTDGVGKGVYLVGAKNANFKNMNWAGISLKGATFENCSFEKCFISARFTNSEFYNCRVTRSRFDFRGSEGLRIHGKKSDWGRDTQITGRMTGATISGNHFGVNAIQVASWANTKFVAAEGKSLRATTAGLMIETTEDLHKALKEVLYNTPQSKVSRWDRLYGLSNQEILRRMEEGREFFKPASDYRRETAKEDPIWDDLDRHSGLRSEFSMRVPLEASENVRMIFYGFREARWYLKPFQPFYNDDSLWGKTAGALARRLPFVPSLTVDKTARVDTYFRVKGADRQDQWIKSKTYSPGDLPTIEAVDLVNRLTDRPEFHYEYMFHNDLPEQLQKSG